MAYIVQHSSGSQSGKCIVCNKVINTSVLISQYEGEDFDKNINTAIRIPVCSGGHYDIVASQKEMIIGHAKTINTHLRKLGK